MYEVWIDAQVVVWLLRKTLNGAKYISTVDMPNTSWEWNYSSSHIVDTICRDVLTIIVDQNIKTSPVESFSEN